MLHYRVGNLLNAPQKVIAHQVNCQGKMGSGVAKAIRDKYPKVYETYLNTCAYNLSNGNSPEHLGGEADFIKINDNREVVNLYGQINYGYNGKRYTNYALLALALDKMFFLLDEAGDREVAIPYKMGCDRGGANWTFVEELLNDYSEIFNVDVYIYSLEGY